jgi:ABC-type transport system involved in multi-copper enzyme maturation permease subunit
MADMIMPLLRNEIAKAIRTKLPYFGFFAVSLICLLAFVVNRETGGQSLNGWGYMSLSMQLVFADIGIIFIAIFSALLIAEETGFGTVRAVLSAPVSRWEFYMAKVLTGLLYAASMLIVSLAVSLCMGLLNYKFDDVTDSMGLIYAWKQVLENFLLALFLSWIPLAAVVTYGVFISTIVKKSGQAVAVTIGTIYIIDFTKHIIGIDPYIFTRYIGFSWRTFNQVAQGVPFQWSPEVWNMIGLSLIYFFLTFLAGLLIFEKRDFNG